VELANTLFEIERPLLKEKLVLWANGGGPQQLDEATAVDEQGSDEEFEEGEDEDDTQSLDITCEQFNAKLVEMDSVAKNLAEIFPRSFGASYLSSLVHSNSQQDFTPAIHVTSVPVTAVRFGNLAVQNRGKKPAATISKTGNSRARSREVMNTAAMSLKTKIDWLVDSVDEVNNRPAKRKYKQPLNSTPTTVAAVDSLLLESEITDLERILCMKYNQRASIARTDNGSGNALNTPTQAIALVAGPSHYYDTTTMFQFTNNIPDSCPLPNFFRALYCIREDDTPQTREGLRNKKRERHSVASVDELGQRKRSIRLNAMSNH
jgi:hypothetical protein